MHISKFQNKILYQSKKKLPDTFSTSSKRLHTVAEKEHRKNNYIVRKKIFANEQKIFMSGPRLTCRIPNESQGSAQQFL